MDFLTERFENKWVVGGIGLALGIMLGLVYAWLIQPVEWIDGTPVNMREDLRIDYLRMAIDSYSVNRNVDLAVERYQQLGEARADTLRKVGEDPEEVDATAIQNFTALAEILQSEGGAEGVAEPVTGPPAEEETGTDTGASPGLATGPMRLILPVCGGTVLIGVLLFAALYLRRIFTLGEEEIELDKELERTAGPTLGVATTPPAEEVLATFRTIYTLGDDLYDDSFSIESPTGDFLGECGVGIGDAIGVGEPKKVSAFEVWLFDKNDIQTVTKVLMSRYAYDDEASRNRLAAKGDPVLARSGDMVALETATLKVEARIVDLKYGEGALPGESFFEQMTVELRALPMGDLTEL